MSLKQLALIVVVLAALAGAGWWLSKPKSAEKSMAVYSVGSKPITPDLAAKTATLELFAKDAETPSVILSRLAGEDRWVVASRQDVPVDFQKLAGLFKMMLDWEVARTFPVTDASRERLELGALRVVLKDASGNSLLALNVGKASTSGGSFAIVEAHPATALEMKSNIFLDTVESNWIERKVASINASDVKEFTVNFAGGAGSIRFSREKSDAPWVTDSVPDDKIINPGAVDRFVSAVVETRSIEELADKQAPAIVRAQELAHECQFVTFDGQRYTIMVGRDPGLPKPESSVEAPAEDVPAWAEGVVESEPKPAPEPAAEEPRYVYATYSIVDAKNPWAAKAPDYAFRVSEYTHEQIPGAPTGFFLDKPKPPVKEELNQATKEETVGNQ